MNPGDASAAAWPAFTFDKDLRAVHDVAAGDIDGDKRLDVATMSDQNDIRWYKIPRIQRAPGRRSTVGPPIHAGFVPGRSRRRRGPGRVRSTAWFENLERGERWVERKLTDVVWSPGGLLTDPPGARSRTSTRMVAAM